MSAIEKLEWQVLELPQYTDQKLPIKRIRFRSRNAGFSIQSSEHTWSDMQVSFYVGPIGLNLNADEAEEVGRALVECAEHYKRALAAVKAPA